MRYQHALQLEELDATVMSSDGLLDPDFKAALREHCERWLREIDAQDVLDSAGLPAAG